MLSLFISAMALQQDNKDLQIQEAQFMEMFLNLSKGAVRVESTPRWEPGQEKS